MRRATVAAVVALILGLTPVAAAHTWWDVDDRCSTEPGNYFYAGGPSQWWKYHPGGSTTFGSCHIYTTNAETQTYNYADWYLPNRSCEWALPASGGHDDGRCAKEKQYTGNYQVLAWLGRESHFTTRKAKYLRYAFSLARGVTSSHVIDQSVAPTGNKLVVTGWFDTRVDSGNSGFMRLIDHTGEPSQTRLVGVDRLYYHPVH